MIFIEKGDVPMSGEQLNRRTQTYINRDWPEWKREKSLILGDGKFAAYRKSVAADTDLNRANNEFNHQVVAYKAAVARLERYVLADGQPEIIEQQLTGEQQLDEESGEMVDVTAPVIIQKLIEPLVATVEITVYDDTGEPIVETVDNPLIIKDNQERSQAHAVVDSSPEDVINW